MKKGKYIDYNIMLACMAKPSTKNVHETSEYQLADSSLLLQSMQQSLGLHVRFISLAQRFGMINNLVAESA